MTVRARKGIVLADGNSPQLYPATAVVPKYLLPLYDKPLVYYPLSTLMLAGITEILVIAHPAAQPLLQRLLGDGSQWGLALAYAAPTMANPIAVARAFLGNAPSVLIHADNVLFGHGLEAKLSAASCQREGATMFACHVRDAGEFPVVCFDAGGRAIRLVAGSPLPLSNYAVTGLYFYDNHVCADPDARITDIASAYLATGTLTVELLGRGMAWLGTGSSDALLDAAQFIAAIEKRQGLRIAVPEEIAYRKGLIDAAALERLADGLKTTGYGHYLQQVLHDKVF